MVNKAIFRVEADVLMRALKMEGVRLHGIQFGHYENMIELVVEHSSLPEVRPGDALMPMDIIHRTQQCGHSCDLGHHSVVQWVQPVRDEQTQMALGDA